MSSSILPDSTQKTKSMLLVGLIAIAVTTVEACVGETCIAGDILGNATVGALSEEILATSQLQPYELNLLQRRAQGLRANQTTALQPAPSRYETVTYDRVFARWLWWPLIIYLFWGMGYICDVYFVRTIEVISERFKIPDDVAGATLMALGCNGPEMALNTISVFHPTNIGVGAVIGGEVFNVLVIIGTAVLATPAMYLPVKVGIFSFARDASFYMISVFILYWVLWDGSVNRVESLILLFGAVCYSTTVVFSAHLRTLMLKETPNVKSEKIDTQPFVEEDSDCKKRSPAELQNNERPQSKEAKQAVDEPHPSSKEDDTPRTDAKEVADEALSSSVAKDRVQLWQDASLCSDASEGSVLYVRVDVRDRIMDRSHPAEEKERFVWLQPNALLVSTAFAPEVAQYEGEHQQGGIINPPICMENLYEWEEDGVPVSDNQTDDAEETPEDTPSRRKSKILSSDSAQKGKVPDMVDALKLRESPWEVIPLEDILYCEPPSNSKQVFTLHVHQHDSGLGKLITLQLSAKNQEVIEGWVEMLTKALQEQKRQMSTMPPTISFSAVLEWLMFPIKFMLMCTIPDMDNPKLQHWYPLSFVMSMCWLAVFAYSVVRACDGIHEDFGISTSVLGFTVAAAGTSFPNVFSGIVVARKGKTTMAIANALGANVQNVFLALAVPWTLKSCFITYGPFDMMEDELTPAIIECVITLLPVVGVVWLCKGTMPHWSGALFLITYFVYLVFAIGQEGTDCATWPIHCS